MSLQNHILTFCDAALEDMYAAGVLHRDLSGGNIMCHPKHHVADGELHHSAQERRCIDYVLYVSFPVAMHLKVGYD